MTEYKAIRTAFQNIMFRSRSEAIFAAYLSDDERAWEYEPFVAPNWMPDFLVDGRIAVDLRVAQVTDDFMSPEIYLQIFDVPLDVDTVWLAPTSPLLSREHPPYAILGWLINQDGSAEEVFIEVMGEPLSYREACAYWKKLWVDVTTPIFELEDQIEMVLL